LADPVDSGAGFRAGRRITGRLRENLVKRILFGIAAAVLIATVSGCSTFDSDWDAAKGLATGIEGRWEGTWSSDGNGHHGGLRCLVTRRSDEGLDARFHATYSDWCGTLGFEYTVPLTAKATPEGWRLGGAADLGWLAGGDYEYDGLATLARFFCNFQSAGDHGVFVLERPR
jgi:hypothetical protein